MNDENTTHETADELESLRQENEELKLAARLRNAREEVTADLITAGARSPELLFGSVISELQFDDAGRTANASALIAHLRKTYPEQFTDIRPTASIDAGAGSGSTANILTAEALGKMSPAEIQRLDWAEVKRCLES